MSPFVGVRYASASDYMTTDELLLFLEAEQGVSSNLRTFLSLLLWLGNDSLFNEAIDMQLFLPGNVIGKQSRCSNNIYCGVRWLCDRFGRCLESESSQFRIPL